MLSAANAPAPHRYSSDAPVIPFVPSSWGGVNQLNLQFDMPLSFTPFLHFSLPSTTKREKIRSGK